MKNINSEWEQAGSRTERRYPKPSHPTKSTASTNKKTGYLKKPKGYLTLLLLFLALVGSLHSHPFQGWSSIIASVLTAVAIDFSYSKRQKRKAVSWDGAIITGLIIALVLSESSPIYVSITASAVAMVSKNILSFKRKPLFNPAALGLLAASIVFSSGQSWWGALTVHPVWWIPCVIISGYLITNKVNKFPQVFSFLGVYFLLVLLLSLLHANGAADALRPPFIQSVLFLAFFMITDPPTSPAKYKDQILFGGIAASVSIGCYVAFGGLSFLLIGVLIANLWKAWKANKNEFSAAIRQVNISSSIHSSGRKHFP